MKLTGEGIYFIDDLQDDFFQKGVFGTQPVSEPIEHNRLVVENETLPEHVILISNQLTLWK